MSLVSSITQVLTQGLSGPELNPASVLTQGFPQTLRPPVAPNTTSTPIVAAGTPVAPGAGRVAVIPNMPKVYDASGNLVYPSSLPSIDLGSGQTRCLPPAGPTTPRARVRGTDVARLVPTERVRQLST